MDRFEEVRQREFSASTAESIFLNHAGVSPSPARVVGAVTEAVQWMGRNPVDFFMKHLLPILGQTRERFARLMGVPSEHLAFTKNTAHGLSIVADGLALEPGDNVVVANCEYPSVVYPWYAQKWRGVETRLVSPRADGMLYREDFATKMDGRTRALAISWVQFGTGFRADLAAFAELAHSHNAILIADLIQGLGALPCAVEAWGVDIAASGVHKWLMAPGGTGGLYIAPHLLERMHLVNMGATSVVNVTKFDPLDFTLKPTAQRYEEGSPNTLGMVGLEAALSLLEEVGIEAIGARILALADFTAQALEEKGYGVVSPREEAQRAGLVMFRHPEIPNAEVMAALSAAKVEAAERGGNLRFSPHFYNTEAEIAQAVKALP